MTRNGEHAGDMTPHIAIDGPAASGKSTLGKAVARELKCLYLDTGQMYRAVTRKALALAVGPKDAESLTRIAQSTHFDLRPRGLIIDGMLAGRELHTPAVDAAVSEISAHASLRAELVRRQRELADGECMVMVGRDIGTTVLPHASVKLWLTASDEERARRRLLDQPDEVAREGHAAAVARLSSRDRYDRTRQHSPLQRAPDAIVIDTGDRTPGQVLEQALAAIRAATGYSPS